MGDEPHSHGPRRFEEAAGHFGRAIKLDGRCEVYHSNRAAALTALRRYAEALEDARAVVRLKPGWAKGWARMGAAHAGLEQHGEVRVETWPLLCSCYCCS